MRGASEMVKVIKEIAAKFPDRVGAAIYKRGQIVMTASKRICPVARDGGTLRGSGMVAKPVRKGSNISVELSYGGAAADYAIAVHETISEHDPPSWQRMYENGGIIQWTSEGTGDHFLSRPIDEAMPTMAADIAADLKFGGKQ